MAKDEDFDLDDFDLDDFDSDIFDGDPGNIKDDRSPVEKVGAGLFDGALTEVTKPDVLRRTIADALPENYSAAAPAINDVSRVVGDLYDTVNKEIQPYKEDLKTAGRMVMNKAGKVVPEKLRNKLNNLLAAGDGGNRLPSAEESGVADALLSLSEGQQQMQEYQDQYQLDLENLKATTSAEQNKLLLRQTELVRRDTARMSAFQDRVTYRYQQKSIELKYRHLFVTRDHYKAFTAFGKDVNLKLKALIKNTGLPDFLKLRLGESGDALLRERLLNKSYSTAGRYFSTFAQRTGKNLKTSVRDFVQTLGGSAASLAMANDAMEGGASIDPLETGGYVAGNELGNQFALKLGRWLRPILEKNPWIMDMGNRAAILGNDYQGAVNDFAKDPSEMFDRETLKGRIFNPLVNWFRTQMDTFSLDGTLRTDMTNGEVDAVQYTSESDMAIREVIPGWLAKIHQSIEKLSGGGQEEAIFNPKSGLIESRGKIKAQAQREIAAKLNPAEDYVRQTIDSLDPDNTLSPDARETLGRYLTFARMSGEGMSVQRMANPETFQRFGRSSTVSELVNFFSPFTTESTVEGQRANRARLAKASESWKNISNDVSIQGTLDNLSRKYGLGLLTDLGLTGYDNNRVNINFDELINYLYTGKKEFNYVPSGASQSGGPNSTDTSGFNPSGSMADVAPGAQVDGSKIEISIESLDRIAQRIDNLDETLKGPVLNMLTAGFRNLQDSVNVMQMDMAGVLNLTTTDRNVPYEILRILQKWDNNGLPGSSGPNDGGPNQGGGGGKRKPFSLKDFDPRTGRFGQRRPPLFDKDKLKQFKDKMSNNVKDFDVEAYLTRLESRVSGSSIRQSRYFDPAYVNSLIEGNEKTSWLKRKVNRLKDKITDVYVKGTNYPALKAELLKAGEYYDEVTGKVIQRLSDIKGNVVNRYGNIVLSIDDIKKGLVDKADRPVSLLSNLIKTVGTIGGGYFGAVGSFYKAGTSLVTGAIGTTKKAVGGFVDLFVKGDKHPRLLAEKLLNGEYIDASTGKVIEKWEDIKGDVKDINGNLILSYGDYLKGLIDNTGRPWLREGLGRIMSAYGSLAGGVFQLPSMITSTVSKAIDFAKDVLDGPQDVYVKGEKNPRLLGTLMANGGYFNQTDKTPILKVSDIKDAVINAARDVLIKADELANLVDKWGNPFKSLKARVGELARLTFGLPLMLVRKGLSVGRNLLSGAGDILSGLFGEGKFSLASIGPNSTKQVDLLTDIRDILQTRLPAPLRKNSWMDQRKTGAKAATPKPETTKDKSANFFSRAISGLMGGLLGRKSNSGDEEDDGSLTDSLLAASAVDDLTGNTISSRVKRAGKWAKGKLGKLWKFGKGFAGGALGLGAKTLGTIGTLIGSSSLGASALSGLSTTGAGITGALSGLGSVGATIAGGLASIFSAPVLLGAGAVAVTGLAGYGLYRYFKRERNQLSAIRLLQYGINPEAESLAEATLALEAYCEDRIQINGNNISIKAPDKKVLDIIEEFGIDTTDASAIQHWMQWFNGRFKPVFIAHQAAIQRFAPGKSFKEVGRLEDDAAAQIFQATKGIKYNDMLSPLADVPPYNDRAQIKELQATGAEYAAADKKDTKSTGAVKGTVVAATAATLASGGAPRMTAAQANKQRKVIPGTIMTGATAITGLGVTARIIGDEGVELDPLMQIRLTLYGLKGLSKLKVNALIALEHKLIDQLIVKPNGKVEFEGSLLQLAETEGGRFGVLTNQDTIDWKTWLEYRFIPVVQTFISALQQVSPNANYRAGLIALKWMHKLAIAQALIETTVEYDRKTINVTQVPYGPYIGEAFETDKVSLKGVLDQLQAKASEEEYQVPVVTPTVKPNSTTTSAAAREQRQQNRGQRPTTPKLTPVQQASRNATLAMTMQNRTSNRYASPLGMIVQHPGNGTAGDINSLPMPTGDGKARYFYDLIGAVGAMTGVDPHLLMTMASIESGFEATVRAREGGSATGLFQFIDTTWAEMLKRYGGKYGLAANAKRTDPRASALMGAEYIKENMGVLEKALGRPVTDTDLYAAHFLGPGDVTKFFKADPNTIAASLLPGPARKNRNIFYTNGRPKTINEVYQHLDGLMRGHSKKFATADFTKAAEAVVATTTPAAATKTSTLPPPPDVTMAKGAPSIKNLLGSQSVENVKLGNATLAGSAPPSPANAGLLKVGNRDGYTTPAPEPVAKMQQERMNAIRAKQVERQDNLREEMAAQVNVISDILTKQLDVQNDIREGINQLVENAHKATTQPATQTVAAKKTTSTQTQRGRDTRLSARRVAS